MKIGELVRDHIDKILSYCEAEPAELVRLMSAEYCRRTFNLAFPFFAEAESLTAHEQRRYWKHRYIFKDRRVRACNHWFEWQRDAFCDYLR